MKKQLNLLFLLFSLAFVGQLSAVKSIEALYEQTQEIARRSVKCTRPDYLAGAVRRLEKMQGELAEKNPETLDQAVTATFLDAFLPLLLDFNRLQINFHDITADDYVALAVLADRADRLYHAVVAHEPQGFARKFKSDHKLMVRSTKAFLKKIQTTQMIAQLFDAIKRVDVEMITDLLARGADANGTNVHGQSPMDVAYLIPAVPADVNRADADACDRATAAKMAIQSLLIECGADTRTVDIDTLCARLAAQRVADVPVEPEVESEEDTVVEEEAAVVVVGPVAATPSVERAAGSKRRGKCKKTKKKRRGRKQRSGQQAGPARVNQVEPVQEDELSPMHRKKTRELMKMLTESIECGQLGLLRKAIKRSLKLPGFSVNDVEVVGECRTAPLTCFAVYQDNGSLELLLKYKKRLKLNLELRDTDECAPLHIAIYRGCLSLVEALVDAGADINTTSLVGKGSNTLHAALMVLYEGRIDDERIFLALLESEGPIDLECRVAGATALQVAVDLKRSNLVRALIDAGATVDVRSEEDGQTPLMSAVCSGDHLCARFLLEAGASGRIADNNGIAPLHQAVGAADVEMVELILKFPNLIDINQRTKHGSTALQVLCCRESAERDLELAHGLILAGADLSAMFGSREGATVLNWACTRPDFELVKFMCEHGAGVNSVDSRKMRPLLIAKESWRGYFRTGQRRKARETAKIIEYLKSRGARVDDGGAGVDGGDDGSDA